MCADLACFMACLFRGVRGVEEKEEVSWVFIGLSRAIPLSSSFFLPLPTKNNAARAQLERKQRDHATLRVDLGAMTLHMEQKQEKERAARERVETLEVPRVFFGFISGVNRQHAK